MEKTQEQLDAEFREFMRLGRIAAIKQKDLWTLADLRTYLDVSADTLWRMRRDGKAPPECRVGGTPIFLKAEVLSWLERLSEEGRTAIRNH